MTVCIGAICEGHIVTVSDTKLSTGYYSHNLGSLKITEIHPLWRAMVSGKLSQAQPFLDQFAWELITCAKEEPALEDLVNVCVRLYKNYAVKLAEESVLAPFGMDMKHFLESRELLGSAVYERVWEQIARIQVGFDLLVCGYGGVQPHIFTVSNPTPEHPSFITHFDDLGFATIGSGSMLAEATLYGFEQGKHCSFEETIYRITCAKFTAESASDVGELTFLRAFDKEGTEIYFDPSVAIELRDQYLASRSQEIPTRAADTIEHGARTANINDHNFAKNIFRAAVKRYRELVEEEKRGVNPKPLTPHSSEDQP